MCRDEELELVRRVQMGLAPDDLVDPYPDTVEWFTSKEEKMRKGTRLDQLMNYLLTIISS